MKATDDGEGACRRLATEALAAMGCLLMRPADRSDRLEAWERMGLTVDDVLAALHPELIDTEHSDD